MKVKSTRPYEAIIVASAFVVYVVRRLLAEWAQLAQLENKIEKVSVNDVQLLNEMYGYSYFTNVLIPILGGAILLLAAWLIFHLLMMPKLIAGHYKSNELWLSSTLIFILIFASLITYHGLMQYVEYVHFWDETDDKSMMLTTHSLYRKRTIVGDAIGIGFLFVFYELISSGFRYLRRSLLQENVRLATLAAYLVPLIPAGCLLMLALFKNLPTPLWSGSTKINLLWIGSIVIVWTLQEYILRYLIPYWKGSLKIFFLHLLVFGAILLIGTSLVWAAYTDFHFVNQPIRFFRRGFWLQSLRILFPAFVFAVFRTIFFKEKIVLQQQVAGTSAELAQLRSQINPHFLFNALNSLYAAAMKEKAEQTADGIQRLGDMMRFMLQENNLERISVDKEIEYLHNYIHLQRIRIDETQGIDIKVILNQPESSVYIAPMMLIPFVENAFKHGVSHRYSSFIFITLSFDATHLYFRVQNSKHMRHEADPEEHQSGIGLQNVQKRLQLLYPGRHTLQIQESDQDYHIFLTLFLW